MDASKKQREPVAFKSLAELKRFIRPGVELKTVSHANHADMVGLTRVVTTVQTVGFYSKIKDQPEHPFSTCNHGKGFYTDFGKAGNYIFDGTTVKVKDTRKQDRGVIYELEFYDREQNMEETMMDRKMVNFIKEQYPPGTRIRLNSMKDPYHPILPGTEGEVDFVDDEGQIFMKWDNGRTLPLAPGEDSFTVLSPKLTTLKLYMPLTADLYERNEYGDLDDSSTLLEGSELRGYQDQIMAALVKNRMPEETERGLMHWYDEADSVDRKVRSAVFTVEVRNRQLWGVAECRVAGELSGTELEALKEYLKLLTVGNTVAALDELYIWLSNPTAIEYIRNCLKRVRKKESAMLLASQNLEDFDQEGIREMTKPLFSIPPHQFLFNAGSIDKRSYMEMLQLDEAEYNLIKFPQRGVCLYKCGNERYLLEVHAPAYKEKLFGTAGGR